jgi:hypothetical protein
MIRAHKIRLHPTPEQANYFARAAGVARLCGIGRWPSGIATMRLGRNPQHLSSRSISTRSDESNSPGRRAGHKKRF